jgi:hypothetical protein
MSSLPDIISKFRKYTEAYPDLVTDISSPLSFLLYNHFEQVISWVYEQLDREPLATPRARLDLLVYLFQQYLPPTTTKLGLDYRWITLIREDLALVAEDPEFGASAKEDRVHWIKLLTLLVDNLASLDDDLISLNTTTTTTRP